MQKIVISSQLLSKTASLPIVDTVHMELAREQAPFEPSQKGENDPQ